MSEVLINKSQIIGEVKERNRLYKALLRVQEIAKEASDGRGASAQLEEIKGVCQEVLKDYLAKDGSYSCMAGI